MKVTTTFWTDEVFEFNELLYIDGETEDVIFRVKLSDQFEAYKFFKLIAKFVKSPRCLRGSEWFQFAVVRNGKVEHIKWFDLVIDDNTTISHDIAFETTMITKNEISVPFGRFPMWAKVQLPKYREFNMKARAYRYMANQVWSLL